MFVWWLLTGGALASWWIGVPAVLLSTAASVTLLSPVTIIWYELPRFLLFFISRSFLGGVDVARRALDPRLPIAPELVEYSIRLPPGLPCAFMANTVSLLPGTLTANVDSRCLTVHVLDGRKDIKSGLMDVELKVATLFGVSLMQDLRVSPDEKI